MGPTSVWMPLLAALAAIGLVIAVVRARRWGWRVGAGAGLLVVGMIAGLITVNDYYGYYQSWSAVAADFGGGGTAVSSTLTAAPDPAGTMRPTHGRIVAVQLAGARSGISRKAYVYLPPQYDEPAMSTVRFPVVELMHGSPGSPMNWVAQLHVEKVIDSLLARHLIGPAVFVMPTINVGRQYSECLDTPGDPIGTYLVADVRSALARKFRVSADPQQWAIGGYSSGGYCATDLALRNPGAYGAAFAIDGYFAPKDGPAAAVLHHNPAAMAANDPLLLPASYRWGDPLPALWLAAGTSGGSDFAQARSLAHRFAALEPVPLIIERHAGHNFYAWAHVLPQALTWSWIQIATPALRHDFPVDTTAKPVVVTPTLPTHLLKILAQYEHSHHRTAKRPVAARHR